MSSLSLGSMKFWLSNLHNLSTSPHQYWYKEPGCTFFNSRVTYSSGFANAQRPIDVSFPRVEAMLTPQPHPHLFQQPQKRPAILYRACIKQETCTGGGVLIGGIIVDRVRLRECWDGCLAGRLCPGRLSSLRTAWGWAAVYGRWPPRSCSGCKFKSLTSVAWLFDRGKKERLRPLVS